MNILSLTFIILAAWFFGLGLIRASQHQPVHSFLGLIIALAMSGAALQMYAP